MPTCSEQYFAEVAVCDAQYQMDKENCGEDPECLQQAISRRQACEQAAYLKYIQCIGSQGGGGNSITSTNPTSGPEGAPGCGCGGG